MSKTELYFDNDTGGRVSINLCAAPYVYRETSAENGIIPEGVIGS